ncbi:MAG TPA: tetratricopeptide repeat protein [Deltaproteobacteria bacterium]|nr:tetratricopeptide repeat protein [Deltaproteobacteria bacterium]HOM30213.1 tetratricopeptide repeat protein [Deltaproteobacteria bacterium]HPP80373.1 tetratricopeptide repeat protein [Deltaproteobacteria bacterium]
MGDPLGAREHLDLGLSYELTGDLAGARREYLRAASLDPSWATPWFNLGNLSYASGDLASAEKHYEEALRRNADDPDVLNNLALTKHGLGKDEEALALVRRALSMRECPAYLDTLGTIERAMKPEGGTP